MPPAARSPSKPPPPPIPKPPIPNPPMGNNDMPRLLLYRPPHSGPLPNPNIVNLLYLFLYFLPRLPASGPDTHKRCHYIFTRQMKKPSQDITHSPNGVHKGMSLPYQCRLVHGWLGCCAACNSASSCSMAAGGIIPPASST